MAQDPNISVPVGTSTSIKTITENQATGVSFDSSGGGTQHIQVIAVGVHDGSGKTLDIVTQSQPLPVTFPTGASEAYDRIREISDAVTGDGTASGITSMHVKIDSSSPLSFTGEIAFTGITTNYTYRQMFVYGVPGATAIAVGGSLGAVAVGVTGQVAVVTGAGGAVTIAGTGPKGFVGITGNVGADGRTNGTPVVITGLNGATAIGVTGQVAITGVATNVAVPVTGGLFVHGQGVGATAMPVLATPPDGGGMTSGLTSGDLRTIRSFGSNHGLSSGARFLARSVGSGSGTFCYVGYATAGNTASMYPLREFESVFIEIDNLNKVAVAGDNSSVTISYLGS